MLHGLAPKCRVENQESLSLLAVTLDTRSLEKSREASSYFGCLELQQNSWGGYARVRCNPSDIFFYLKTAIAMPVVPLQLALY